jgi:hypothetical protein
VVFPARWAAGLLAVGIVVPVAVIWAQRTPAENPPPGNLHTASNPAVAPAAAAKHSSPDFNDLDEVQGGRAQFVGVLSDVQQAVAWLVSMIPIVVCVVGFLVLVIVVRKYARRISEEMAQLEVTLERPLEHRDKFD